MAKRCRILNSEKNENRQNEVASEESCSVNNSLSGSVKRLAPSSMIDWSRVVFTRHNNVIERPNPITKFPLHQDQIPSQTTPCMNSYVQTHHFSNLHTH
ncbi:hypothetical protein VitviT2T_019390 [Vitis vinifera]|uniref:Uncharacterized protein n=1 Tax=Vitis vinifera TaxID=29760 RepID=A0ABY9D144_VITVI|nr:hypothetical protein VitviT2T_019390 [Vitis vinifera]